MKREEQGATNTVVSYILRARENNQFHWYVSTYPGRELLLFNILVTTQSQKEKKHTISQL